MQYTLLSMLRINTKHLLTSLFSSGRSNSGLSEQTGGGRATSTM